MVEVTFNFEKYLEYCEATQYDWKLNGYVNSIEYVRLVFDAVGRSNSIQSLDVTLSELPEGSGDRTAELMVAGLALNSSLQTLILRQFSASRSWVQLLDLLGSKNQLKEIQACFGCDILTDFDAYLRFLRKSTELRVIYMPSLNDEQTLQVIDALDGHDKLEVIYIDFADPLQKSTINKIAEFLNRNINIQEFTELPEFEDQDYLETSVTPTMTSRRKDRSLKVEPEPAAVTVVEAGEGNMPEFFLNVIPSELVKAILFTLNMGPLMAFLRVNKQAQRYCRRHDFWREYYLMHFDCIPAEILEAINYTHGKKLMELVSLEHVEPANIWLMALQHLQGMYQIPVNSFPRCYSSLKYLVARSFPQLSGNWFRNMCTFNDEDDSWDWFLAGKTDGSYSNHLMGVHLRSDGQYSAIVLQRFLYVDHFIVNKQFEQLEYVFEWITAQNAIEFQTKIKPLCDIMMASYYATPRPYYWRPLTDAMPDILTKSSAMRSAVSTEIERCAEKICADLGDLSKLPNLVPIVGTIIQRLQDMPVLEFDFVPFIQRLPKRSELNGKYRQRGLWYDFTMRAWCEGDPKSVPVTSNTLLSNHKKSTKLVPKVCILRAIRIALNCALMPLLRVFWARNLRDTDCEHYWTWPKEMLQKYDELYNSPLIPLDHVTITSAQPKNWPGIALAAAQLIAGQLGATIGAVINDELSGKDSSSVLHKTVVNLACIVMPLGHDYK